MDQPAIKNIKERLSMNREETSSGEAEGIIVRLPKADVEELPQKGRKRRCRSKMMEPLKEIDKITGETIRRNKNFIKEGQWTVVYTDGSCRNNGKDNCVAGLGVYFGPGHVLNKGRMVEGKHQSNNIGEIQAIKLAVKIAIRHSVEIPKLIVRSDSKYTLNMIEQLPSYKKRGWKTTSNKQI